MMKSNSVIKTAIALAVSAILTGAPLAATTAFAKKEKKACTTCHAKQGSKELNDTGKAYKEKGSLPEEKK